jgi:hypothetical protein
MPEGEGEDTGAGTRALPMAGGAREGRDHRQPARTNSAGTTHSVSFVCGKGQESGGHRRGGKRHMEEDQTAVCTPQQYGGGRGDRGGG